jgi:hypothetical protein
MAGLVTPRSRAPRPEESPPSSPIASQKGISLRQLFRYRSPNSAPPWCDGYKAILVEADPHLAELSRVPPPESRDGQDPFSEAGPGLPTCVIHESPRIRE